MKQRINQRVQVLPPSGIRRFFDLVSEMKGVISLGVGAPEFVTPWHIREACFYALEKGYTMYTSNRGLLELRQEIARDLKRHYDLVYDPRTQILVTVGVSEAVDLAIRAIIEPGDEVFIPEPCYVSYGPCVFLAGGEPVYVRTSVEHDFRLQPRDLEAAITPRTKALVLCYPNNPTGAVMDREALSAIAEVVARHDLLVVADEVYAHLTYGAKHVSFAGLPGMGERTILLNGFSKAYAMTGWRLGYAVGPAEIIEAMNKIHQYTMLCAPITAQKAAIEALRNGDQERERMVTEYDRRRRFFVKRLNEIGLTCFEPRGAFYAFPSVAATGLDGLTFAEELLREEKVAVVPGEAFGPSGRYHIRCSYASSMENLKEALVRMERFLARRKVAVGKE
ncbi:MAG: aminotransferase class I/II-fold pyridoxal phosphate-dependent enzyme [Firmicutes bacterium]|nr:aminotransferase class I/II-fold pyridoxal phosphate-dependent enzyme [Bacillota bacterium]